VIVWLWDAGSVKGVTDNESHALKVAEVSMHGTDAATVRVESAVLVIGVCTLTMGYRRTGMGWLARRVSNGSIAWEPLKAEREYATETSYA
jgi:hypothetical protein